MTILASQSPAKPAQPKGHATVAVIFGETSYTMSLELHQISSHNHFDSTQDPDYPCLQNATPNGLVTVTLVGRLIREVNAGS